nr:Transmembrane protein like [Ipomoea batatas]
MLSSGGGGGRIFWVERAEQKVKGIVVLFAWVSIQESHLKNYTNLYSSLGWNSLVCFADFLNPYIHERATSLAFSVACELVEELKCRPCPVVLAAFSGGSKACMYKFFQIIEGACEAQLNLEESRMVANCIAGQMFDSGPVDFTADFGARFAVPPTLLKVPGSAKLVSMVARGFTSGMDALFLTRFGSQNTEYWQTLYSTVSFEAPFLILCSENDDLASFQMVSEFAQRLQDTGGSVRIVKWKSSPHVGHFKSDPIQYRAAVTELLASAVSVFNHKIQKLGDRMEGIHDDVSDLICDLQNAAVDSNESLRRVALGPNDHFFLPSSAEYRNSRDYGCQQEQKEKEKENTPHRPNLSINAHSVLGQILFDACVPKNVEGWDIKFSSSSKGHPFTSRRKHSPQNAKKCLIRSRL